jgi:hypothetical protein
MKQNVVADKTSLLENNNSVTLIQNNNLIEAEAIYLQ